MSFEIPNLDRKNWQQLVLEMMRRIPQYTRQWTDYNDSDPGITLLQMLAWIDESLLYQANRIPLETEQNFLREVLGLPYSSNQTAYSQAASKDGDVAFLALQQLLASMEQGTPLTAEELKKAVLSYTAAPYMALTLEDIDALALQANRMIAQQAGQSGSTPLLVKRAYTLVSAEAEIVYILSDGKWQYQFPPYPNQQEYEGSGTTYRKTLMFASGPSSQALSLLLQAVSKFLAPRVLAGNQITVNDARLTPINLSLQINCAAATRLDVTVTQLFAKLFRYFLPCEGGADGTGWAYNQEPQADDIRDLIFSVPGINSIELFDYSFIPTMQLDQMASLDVNAQITALPAGTPGLFYSGLPCLRCLDITARSSQA